MDLNQVTLPVKNMDEAVGFYLTLGFTQIVDTPHYARFSCPSGNSTFSLSLETNEFNNGAVIYFESEHLDELVTSLIQKGILFETLVYQAHTVGHPEIYAASLPLLLSSEFAWTLYSTENQVSGTPIFLRILSIRHHLVKPLWNRFAPTKTVNHNQ